MKFGGIVLPLVILVVALWPDLFGTASKYVLVIAAVLLLLKGLSCCNCGSMMKAPVKAAAKRKKRL